MLRIPIQPGQSGGVANHSNVAREGNVIFDTLKFLNTLAVAPLVALLATSAFANTVTFSDVAWADSSWTAQSLAVNSPGASFVFTAGQVASGGNSGPFRETTHQFQGPGTVGTAQVLAAAFYDPAVQGAIATVDGTFDLEFIAQNAASPNAVGYSLLIGQGGLFYKSPVVVTVLPFLTWMPFSYTGLTANDFSLATDAASHPDFSATGGTIQVGFATFNGDGTGQIEATESGIDNYSISLVSSTPEPTSMVMLSGGLLALVASRWNRRHGGRA